MNRLEKAHEVNHILKAQRTAINESLPQILSVGVTLANGDAAKARIVTAAIGSSISLMDARAWTTNMTTRPGELVYDPQQKYIYAYTGATAMTHANTLFYPGASGVYYWAIIPPTMNEIKVYPDIPGIIVAVKQGELWWNTERTTKFKWRGLDNANCVWPPVNGNEWEVA